MRRSGLRSEERFSRNAETDLVCRLLLEKKKRMRMLTGQECCTRFPHLFFFLMITRQTKSTLFPYTTLFRSEVDCWRKMRKFDLSLRSSRSSYFATFRHQLTFLSKTDALDEEKWLNMLGTFVKDWFRYESHFVHGRDSLVDILKERGLLSESDAVQPLIGKKS